MATVELNAHQRTVLGKKSKRLRLQGIVPANIYGRNVVSTPIEVPQAELRRVIKAAGHTGLVRLTLDGGGAPRTALIRAIQRQFTTGNVIHVDFQEVSMTVRMTVRIPVVLHGDSPVAELGGVVVQSLDAVDVECLPGDIPAHLEADISGMTELNSQFHVRDLKVPANVTVLTDPAVLLATVAIPLTEEEATEEVPSADAVPTTAEDSAAPEA
jgi:large subunit ribosomal protein L25